MFIVLVIISLVDVKAVVCDYLFDESWIENSFNTIDLGSIALTLYDWYGWPLIILSLLLFMAMLVAIDIARSKIN
jgi:NADH:ubiquinone oxidoreductase subunit 6 (subunit J)